MDSVMQQFSDWLKGTIKETLNKLLEIEQDDGFPKELPAKRWSKRAIKKWLENQI